MTTFFPYLWFLLPKPLKRTVGELETEVRRTVDVLASMLDDARQMVFDVRRAWMPHTASGAALDQHGIERWMTREPGETDEQYQARLAAAFELHQQGGTIPGMVLAMERLGYDDAEVIEPKTASTRHDGAASYDGSVRYDSVLSWATFIVRVEASADGLSEDELARLLRTVRRSKPAHTMLAWLAVSTTPLLDDEFGEADDDGLFLDVAPSLAEVFPWPCPMYDGAYAHDGAVAYGSGMDSLMVEVTPA